MQTPTRPARPATIASLILSLPAAVALSLGVTGCGQSREQSPRDRDPVAAHSSAIIGVTGTAFNLTAKTGYISTPDGGSLYTWGYASDGAPMQYPGPTLIVNQGELITVQLSNQLSTAVSIVFPGHRVTAQGGTAGQLTSEAPPGGTVSYQFRATNPGTYIYYSGTRPELQIEMGLVGALIVRPSIGPKHAYNHAATAFDRETLFLLTEMDPKVHELAAAGQLDDIDFTTYSPVYWFINGRAAPDTMVANGVSWLPHQPYASMPRMHPGERLLMRVVGGGRHLHPFHHHGNHARVIGVDGRMAQSQPGLGPDLSYDVFTVQSVPGATVDAIFEWTGKGLGWDIYGDPAENGHNCTDGDGDDFDDTTSEYCPDHGKLMPVTLPQQQNLTFGGFYSGSPYLGTAGTLPPGEGGLNPNAGFTYMWHSHSEKEMVNNDLFPGGMMTMLFVEPPGVPID